MNARSTLSSSSVFDLFQSLVGAPKCHRTFLAECVQPREGDHLLDIGRGVGATLGHLPPGMAYTGIDISASYIKTAQARFGGRGTFICANGADIELPENAFDCAIAFGVVHHLDDTEAGALLRLARSALRPGWRPLPSIPAMRRTSPGWCATSSARIAADSSGMRPDIAGCLTRTEPVICRSSMTCWRGPYTHIIGRVDIDK